MASKFAKKPTANNGGAKSVQNSFTERDCKNVSHGCKHIKSGGCGLKPGPKK